MLVGPSRDPPTPHDLLRYVLLGSSQSGIFRSLDNVPSIPRPEDPLFPVLIVCTSPDIAQSYMLLDPYFRAFTPRSLEELDEKLDMIGPTSRAYQLLNEAGNFYPVHSCVWPKPMKLIWTHWSDAYPYLRKDRDPGFCKRPTLRASIKRLMTFVCEPPAPHASGPAPPSSPSPPPTMTSEEEERAREMELLSFYMALSLSEDPDDDIASSSSPPTRADSRAPAEDVLTASWRPTKARTGVASSSTTSRSHPAFTDTRGGRDRAIAAPGASAHTVKPAISTTQRHSTTLAPSRTAPTSTMPQNASTLTGSRTHATTTTTTTIQRAGSVAGVQAASGTPSSSRTRGATSSSRTTDTTSSSLTTGTTSSSRTTGTAPSSRTTGTTGAVSSKGARRVDESSPVVTSSAHNGVFPSSSRPSIIIVHSLGKKVDRHVDDVDHSAQFIELLYVARAQATNFAEFYSAVANILETRRAEWYWRHIQYPVSPPIRDRLSALGRS